MKLQEAVQLTPPKIILFGQPGGWKTTFATSWGSVTEVLDCDGKLHPCLKVQDQWTSERAQVEVTSCLDTDTKVPIAFEKLKQRVFAISDLCGQKKYEKKVLVLDSLTSAGEHAMRKIIPGLARGIVVPLTQAQWGMAINEVENMLVVLKSLPICVIVVAHEMTQVVDDTTKTRIWALGAKLPDKLPVGFHEIWYSKMLVGAGSDRRPVLQTIGSNVVATTRGGLPDGWDVRKGLRETLKQIGYE